MAMIGQPRPGRYRLHRLGSPEAEAALAEHGLTRADLDRALAKLERSEGICVRTIVGINDDGVFGATRAGWRADLPGALKEPFIPLLWLRVHELLGRVPQGSTARFLQDGTLPPGAMTLATTAADGGLLATEEDDVGALRDPAAAG